MEDVIRLEPKDNVIRNQVCANKTYLVEWNQYDESSLRIRTGRFDKSSIIGFMKNVTTVFNTANIVYKNVLFEDCTFLEQSWIDMTDFKKCTFVNCKFYGEIRWTTFDECNFKQTSFNMEYVRATTLRSNCLYDEFVLNVEQIDEYVWLFGKKHTKEINLECKN